MKINRLLQITMLLMNKNDLTVKYLADQFEVSKKTIYRDLETLITSGVPVCYGDNQDGRISILEGYSLKYSILPDKESQRKIFDMEMIGQIEPIKAEEFIYSYSKAWKAFANQRSFDVYEIKQEILHSWTRCRQMGVFLYDVNMQDLVTPKETAKYVLRKLPEYQKPEYQIFSNIVKSLDLDITIYDKHAQLKYIVNIDPMYEKLYPQIGYFKDASEQNLGTNSTNIALIENKPCMVIGPEHYKKLFHKFSCAAAPIYSGTKLIGTVNSSFVHTSVSTDTLNIVFSLARLYEKLILHKDNGIENIKNDEHNFHANRIRGEVRESFDTIWGESQKWLSVIDIAKGLSKCNSTILIKGEEGTGKKTIARCMHSESNRKYGPCIVLDCKSIPKKLSGITLFGYEATLNQEEDATVGVIEQAAGGTLVIENIHVLSKYVQKRLYKFLSEGKMRRLGGKKILKFDVRIIVCMKLEQENAIFELLQKEIQQCQLIIPPLRERKEDIKILAKKRIEVFLKENRYKLHDFRSFRRLFEEKRWSGNVTELFHTLDKIVVLADSVNNNDEMVKLIEEML
jgi:transcriptional regulator of acetoin/glycerol metabolism